MKKALSILLAVLMLASCLAACAPAEPDETQGNTPQPSATTPGGTGPTAQGPEVPALKGPGNIVIKSVYQNVAFDPNADISAQLIEEVTGYKAEYIMLPAENANEKLAMDAASGADYDIIRCSVDQFNMLLSSGALMPLNDLLEVYGPDIIAGYTQETWDAVSDSNGTIYGIPYKYASDQEVASFLTCRWDLMQAAGIEKLPQTLDEFYDCLVTLKNYYGDEYIILTGPFLPTTEKNENWRFPKSIASAFGIWNEWMVDENGEVIYMTEAEGFEDMLTFLKKLYDEGLIDADWAVNTNDSVNEKFSSGRAIITCSSRTGCNVTSPAIISNLGITYDDLAYIGALKGPDGTCTYMSTEALSSVSVILKSCDNAADVINWCNLKLQNQLYLNFGVEGVHFTYDEEGTMVPINPTFSDERSNSYWYCNAMDMAAYQKDWPARLRKTEAQWDCWNRVTVVAQQNTPEIFVDNPFKYLPASEAYSTYNTSLHTLLNDFIVQVISSSKTYADLDSLVKDWTAAGGEEVRSELQNYLNQK